MREAVRQREALIRHLIGLCEKNQNELKRLKSYFRGFHSEEARPVVEYFEPGLFY